MLEADPRNEEIQSLLAGLGDAPAHESTASAPASPAEPSFDTAPRREYAPPSHAPPPPFEPPELLDLEVALPDAAPAPVVADSASDRYENEWRRARVARGDRDDAGDGRSDAGDRGTGRWFRVDRVQRAGDGRRADVGTRVGVRGGDQRARRLRAAVAGARPPATDVEAVPGLAASAFPELEEPLPEDRGDVLPPHGDPIVGVGAAAVRSDPGRLAARLRHAAGPRADARTDARRRRAVATVRRARRCGRRASSDAGRAAARGDRGGSGADRCRRVVRCSRGGRRDGGGARHGERGERALLPRRRRFDGGAEGGRGGSSSPPSSRRPTRRSPRLRPRSR